MLSYYFTSEVSVHDTSLRMCMVDPDARAHGKDMRVRVAILRACAWLLTAQVYYWQSCVQDSSIGDLVSQSLTHSLTDVTFDFSVFRALLETFERLVRDF